MGIDPIVTLSAAAALPCLGAMTPEPIEIRCQGVEIVDELEPLFLELHARHVAVAPELLGLPACTGSTAWARRRVRYLRAFEHDATFVVVARTGDAIAGYAIVVASAGYDGWGTGAPLAEVKDLVVAAAARRHGIGAALLDAVRERLGDEGVTHYRLDVLLANEDALAFYARCGLEPTVTTLNARTSI